MIHRGVRTGPMLSTNITLNVVLYKLNLISIEQLIMISLNISHYNTHLSIASPIALYICAGFSESEPNINIKLRFD